LREILLVGLGGMAGSIARYLLSTTLQRGASFPVGTLAVNVIGCFLMGLLAGLVDARSQTRLLLGTGVMGGFTTFSAFGFETIALIRVGAWSLAACNVGANVVFGLVSAGLGAAVAERLGR
jgi:CrcB protein